MPIMTLSNSELLDPFSQLEQDHLEVDELFDQYSELQAEKADGLDDLKREIVQTICDKLNLHSQLEEEIIYPALGAELDQPELIEDAKADHSYAAELISHLEAMDPSDGAFDDTVQQLMQEVRDHVLTEESEIFPLARESGLDMEMLAMSLQRRRGELEPQLPGEDDDPSQASDRDQSARF